jgi:hypothetical protein
MSLIDAETTKQVDVAAKVGDKLDDGKGAQREVLEITITKDGPRYKLDQGHRLVVSDDNEREVVFECEYCRARVAFVHVGLGDPCVVGDAGDRRPPDDYMNWMDKCSIS